MRTSVPLLFLLCSTSMLVDVASADIGVPTRCGLSDQRNARHAQRLSQHLASTNPRPSLPFFADAASGRFRVHYARLGVDAVPVQDDNVNGLPDYVEEALIALDSVWRTEIDVLGFAVPPGDRDSGGSAAVDVYLRDLSKENGTGLYGVTRFEDLVSPQGPWDRFSTFMEIDNDFSPTDRNAFDSLIYTHTNGIEALRVTCAHEFHHVIQLGRYGFTGVQLMFYELTSTWMEQRVYPESYDWHLYTSALLRLPEGYAFSRGDALNGYAWGWFAWALQERSDTLLRHAWDRIASGDRPYAALVRACADVGTSFSDVFCSTMASMYHTGSRGAGNAYMRGAELLPEIRLDADERALPPSTSVGGAVRPFEVRAMRFTVPGSARQQVAAGMILTAPNEQALVDASTSVSVAYNVTATEDPQVGDDAIAGSSWGIRTTPRDELCTYVDGIRTVLPDGPYPQPLVLSTHSVLRFPVQDAAPGEEAVIDVRSASYGQASSFVVTVELDGDRIVAPLTDLQQFGTGIYLVDVTCLGRTTLYKVMIRR